MQSHVESLTQDAGGPVVYRPLAWGRHQPDALVTYHWGSLYLLGSSVLVSKGCHDQRQEKDQKLGELSMGIKAIDNT